MKQNKATTSDSGNEKRIFEERTRRIAQPVIESEDKKQAMNGLGFLLSDEEYIIDENYVQEVLPLMQFTPLPCTPDFILGIINVRGRIVSVINLKSFLKLPAKGITNLNRVILVKKAQIEIALLVDEITENMEVDLDTLQKDLGDGASNQNKFISGYVRNGSVVFDIARFLEDEKIIINEEI